VNSGGATVLDGVGGVSFDEYLQAESNKTENNRRKILECFININVMPSNVKAYLPPGWQ
jgi:hypothetical protein